MRPTRNPSEDIQHTIPAQIFTVEIKRTSNENIQENDNDNEKHKNMRPTPSNIQC